jgi:Fur family iron response transcriptional regulator
MQPAISPQRKVRKLLKSKGIAPTNQRVNIAMTILEKPQHLSAEQVFEASNARSDTPVSKATVYNALGLFARSGLIRELRVDPDRVFYDSSTHPHHHYYNSETQEIFDIDPGQLTVQLPQELPPGMEIDSVDIVVHLRQGKKH